MPYRKESVPNFARNLGQRIEEESRRNGERLRVNNSVVLRKRMRNANDNDRLGTFSPYTGSWTSDLNTNGIYSLNITTATIRTNVSAMITANVKVDIVPRFIKDSKSQMAADVADAVIEQKNRLQWTNQLEELVATEQQAGPGVFIRTNYNPHLKRKHAVPQFEDQDIEMPGSALCTACGEEVPVSGEIESQQIACSVCGGMAVVDSMPTTASIPVPTGYSEFTTGDTQTTVIPFFEVRMDTTGTQGGDLQKAKWFEHHFITSLDELQVEYPEAASEIQGATHELSYPLQWQLALRNGNIIPVDMSASSVIEYREVRDIFITPAMYLNVALDSFELASPDGKNRFSVEQGKTFADAKYDGETPDEPPTVCLRLVGSTLIDIYPCDFKKEFAYVTFFADPSSPWGLFLTDLCVMQDIINQMVTLQMYHIKRNAITSIIYNSNAFDPDAFQKDLIPTADTLPPDVPVGNAFAIIPALRMSGEPMEMLKTVMELKSDISLTTPALMGQAQPNEPYHAQLLQRQSSLGLLAPAELSKAHAKVQWAKQQLRLVKQNWTDEDTAEYLKLNGEWTEEFIQAFLDCDFENDLNIGYVEGSEIPQSQVEREVKLQKLLSDMMSFAQLAPQMITPQMMSEVFAELVQVGGLDIDFNNTESDLRLAEARYDKIIDAIGSVDTENPEMNAVLAQQLLQMPDMTPHLWEGHDTQIEYYSDKLRNECAKEAPDYLLITVLNGLIQLHLQAETQKGQLATGMQMAIQAPAMEAQQEQQNQQLQLQAAQDAERAEVEQADKEQATEEAATQRDHEMNMKVLDLAGQEMRAQ